MYTRIENNGEKDITILVAEEGKVLRRKGTNDLFGSELSLGYSYYIEGVYQNPPHLDVVEDFEEIDIWDDDSDIDTNEALEILLGHDA